MKLTLVKILQSQGFGSRKVCTQQIKNSGIKIEGEIYKDPSKQFETNGLVFEASSETFQFREKVYIALHKPEGFECSNNPQNHESAMDLLPQFLINRGIQMAGRLDVDTSGILLLSDDGQFIHHVTSPNRNITKRYTAGLKHPFSSEQKAALEKGVELRNEKGIFRASDIEEISENEINLTIDSGCYHQVKRMFAAVSNRIESLQRIAIGELGLENIENPEDWRYLEEEDLKKVYWPHS